MGYIGDQILLLSKQLYPTGRAFKLFDQSVHERLHKALAKSEERAYNAATSILYSILPDNDNFTSDDATDWERRLGLITNLSISLSNRKAAIRRKLSQPGNAPAKSNWRYLQEQLQAAGFDVYVYENRFQDYPGEDYFTKTPGQISGNSGYFITNRHGMFQHGQVQHGGHYTGFCANYIDELQDYKFVISPNLRSTFFIGGSILGNSANIPSARHDEFRQLILTLKPVQTVAFLFINYT